MGEGYNGQVNEIYSDKPWEENFTKGILDKSVSYYIARALISIDGSGWHMEGKSEGHIN